MSIECLSASPDIGAIRPYVPDGTKIAISVEIACLVLAFRVISSAVKRS